MKDQRGSTCQAPHVSNNVRTTASVNILTLYDVGTPLPPGSTIFPKRRAIVHLCNDALSVPFYLYEELRVGLTDLDVARMGCWN